MVDKMVGLDSLNSAEFDTFEYVIMIYFFMGPDTQTVRNNN